MFKTLLATLMLSTSFGTPLIKTTPKMANTGYYTLSGAYTFNDNFDFSSIDEPYNLYFDSSFEITVYIGGTGRYGVDYVCDCTVDELIINVTNYYVEFSLNWTTLYGTGSGGPYNIIYTLPRNNAFTIDDFGNYYEGETFPTEYDFPQWKNNTFYIRNFMLYFKQNVVLDNQAYRVFSHLFNNYGNKYTYSYNGWYHYRNDNFYQTNRVYYMSNTLFITENTISKSVQHEEELGQYGREFTFYDNGNYPQRLGNIQVSAMLPNFVRETMEIEGVFAFVQAPIEQYTFAEFFFSIMDAPLYYLSSLFNIEVFGLSLFWAFTSMITFAIIIIVIKKVV